jgi:hypothetical protein
MQTTWMEKNNVKGIFLMRILGKNIGMAKFWR